ncbi:MAG: hypothetical protein EBZ17_12075, partial [Actinobacteria bacterium]|nr:hypothetical protein [Actinomycetota bacterium]
MSAVVEGRRKGLFRRGSAPADASVDAPSEPEKGKKSGKRRGKEKPIGLPQVNLLPDEISDAIKARKIVKAAIFVLVLVLGGLAGLWWMQGSAISQAQTTLATAQATQQDLNAKITALQPVTDLYNELTLLQDAVTTSLADQPQASLAFLRLESAAASVPGAPIEITQVSTSYQGIPEPGGSLNSCPNPNPFGAEITVGCVNFSATATDRGQVSELLRVLENDPLFIGPFITSTSVSSSTEPGQPTEVSFSGTV